MLSTVKSMLTFWMVCNITIGVPVVINNKDITARAAYMEYHHKNNNQHNLTKVENNELAQMSQILNQMVRKTYRENPRFTKLTMQRMEELQKSFLNQYGPAIELGLKYITRGNSSHKRDTATSGGTKEEHFKEILQFVELLFPGSDRNSVRIKSSIKNFLLQNEHVIKQNIRRQDSENEIDFDDASDSSSEKSSSSTESDKISEGNASLSTASKQVESSGNQPPRVDEGINGPGIGDGDSTPQGTAGDSDSDEPPGGGDGQGGGLLGFLAGLSGGEDGQSDLGSLLATVGGIVASLSGDGFDLNSLIASAVGLLAGLLSEGMQNPGAVVASYLVTTLESITGGGATNNGAFFGNFVSKLIKGSSAAGDGENPDEGAGGSDSAGFFLSLIAGLSGSSSGHK